MPSAGFEPAISLIMRMQNYALDGMASGIGITVEAVASFTPYIYMGEQNIFEILIMSIIRSANTWADKISCRQQLTGSRHLSGPLCRRQTKPRLLIGGVKLCAFLALCVHVEAVCRNVVCPRGSCLQERCVFTWKLSAEKSCVHVEAVYRNVAHSPAFIFNSCLSIQILLHQPQNNTLTRLLLASLSVLLVANILRSDDYWTSHLELFVNHLYFSLNLSYISIKLWTKELKFKLELGCIYCLTQLSGGYIYIYI